MAPVLKRLTISETGSTSSIGTGVRPVSAASLKPKSPRSVISRELCSSTARVYSLNVS